MTLRHTLIAALLALATMAGAQAEEDAGQRWRQHAQEDLLPWWTQAAAQGEPLGRFPTFRCNDGSVYLAAAPCHELAQAPDWIKSELKRDYVRMQSRQIYTYAMGFHLTGDIKLLKLAQAGVADLRARALDKRTGSAASWFENGKPQPAIGMRNAQDLSYAGLGMAAVYYLTRDPLVLSDLIKLKQHIFTHQDPKTGLIRWQAKDGGNGDAQREELVATLDQLNAYLILVTPILPEGPLKRRWQEDIGKLSGAMVKRFHDADRGRFWGTRGLPDSDSADGRHNDFGHTVKAYWMLYLAARQNQDVELARLARDGMRKTLDAAWLQDSSSWGERWRQDGSAVPHKSWWIYAELDQAAATLAVQEGDDPSRWQAAGQWWLKHFVAAPGGEVWGSVSADGNARPQLRQHHWKNGFHSMEHALVNYLASQALADQPATLYYATPATRVAARFKPYTFEGHTLSVEKLQVEGTTIQKVSIKLDRYKR
ncbi:hypothetical protein QWZ03_09835 [Chitinimonas viridis]|uniref:N-acylglucosamine 2-epimerase n=1 Tax=Chitinimonas viridis TaxID=664880 RepID=A0ABT8B4Z5_9NEIS|nr:hypothetical protein [Chitinimonas viridis]MDN3577065.1 hypothetical protein [Chitinimonas viridis]